MNRKILAAGILSLLACLAFGGEIKADIAPALQPPGAVPAPADFVDTDIQMAIESVVIDIEEPGRLYYDSAYSDTVNARVNATFAMANPGEEEIELDVVFPLTNIEGYGDGRFAYPEIQNFQVSANYEQLSWETITTPNPRGEEEEPVRWAQFKVKFLTGELTFIDVSYEIQSTGYFPIAAFSYILETGSGWAGPIGEAFLTLELPYEATEENVLVGSDVYFGMGGENNPAPEFEGNKVKWRWSNLEPTRDDNWGVAIFAPHIWQQIIGLREEMAKGKIGAARDITNLYDGLIMDRGIRQGAEGLVTLNIEAYNQALVDDEWDADVRARYANFLLFLYGFGRETDKYPGMLDEVYQIASEAQAIDQFNPTAMDVLKQLENVYDYEPPEVEVENTAVSDVEPTVEELPEIINEDEELPAVSEANSKMLVYVLGGGLAVSLMAIIFLVNRMGKMKGKN